VNAYREVTPVDIVFTTVHSTHEDGEATITVRPRCECGSKHWFQCRCNVVSVTYTSVGIDQTGSPCLDFLRAVVRAHPGCDYIFTPLLHLQRETQAILNGGR